MKVTAIKPAFYDGRRIRVGDDVEVADNFKAAWFVKTDSPAAKAAKAAPAKEKPKALSEVGNDKAKSFNEAMKPDIA